MHLDIIQFIADIKDFSYILINVDTPYMPKDFPESYPVGKDIDILIVPEEYEQIKNKTELLIANYPFYDCKVIEDTLGYRLRFEKKNKLHFQIHIITTFKGLPLIFLRKSIQERRLVNGYYVPLRKYELIYRLLKYRVGHKKWHKKYVQMNAQYASILLLKTLKLYDFFKEIRNAC